MLQLFIGNKAYSSWSLRGWLAVRASGLSFEEVVVPLYDADWDRRRGGDEFAPSAGKVPILWDRASDADGDGRADADTGPAGADAAEPIVVWDSLAIIDYLDERTGGTRGYWPRALAPRAMARSMAAEMHAGFAALRRDRPMNIRRIAPPAPLGPDAEADVGRIVQLWAEARARFGGEGDYLFGDWSAADMMFAPVVSRFITYSIPLPPFALAYMQAVISHKCMQDWIGGAQAEDWVIEKFEGPEQG